jgi:glycosyltransferase involved in cell wall biosynthesis
MANFAKRLPRFGWNASVLTLKDRYLQSIDAGKLDYVGNAKIFKAGQTPTLLQAYLACAKAARLFLNKSAGPGPAGAITKDRPAQAGESIARKLRRYVLAFLTLPDMHRNWVVPAVVQAVRIVRREKIDCILTSCPPYSVHLVGWLVKRITGVRWIADFRDPWMTASSKSLYATCSASLSIERWMERTVVKNADRIVANTEMLHAELKKVYGSSFGAKFVYIPNGFDGEFFSRYQQLKKEEGFSIVYTGSLYFGRTPEPVFQALQQLFEERAIERQEVRFRLVGQCRSVGGRPIDEMIDRYRLKGVVEVIDPVPYSRAIEMVRKSHLALLLAPDQPYQIPAKVYDYMGTGTCVLAIAKEGATAVLIRHTRIGAAFDPTDIPGVKDFISRCFKEREPAGYAYGTAQTKQFELDSISQRLADELERTCGSEHIETESEDISELHQR